MTTRAPIGVDQRLLGLIATEASGNTPPCVIGIAGPPGAGKSTLAAALMPALAASGLSSVVLPMDGFHLASAQLEKLALLDRKGAVATFDAQGFLSCLQRVRAGGSVYVPDYSRVLDEPIAASIHIEPGTDVVIVEGLYLLLGLEPWGAIKPLLDVPLFLDTGWDQCRERLLARRLAGGQSMPDALRWVDESDLANHNVVLRDSDLEGVLTMRNGVFA